jgi:hypothetical protein
MRSLDQNQPINQNGRDALHASPSPDLALDQLERGSAETHAMRLYTEKTSLRPPATIAQ